MIKIRLLFLFLLTALLSLETVFAADRYSISSGNWNSTSTWSATSGGAPGASAPVAGDNVYIESNHTITVTADAECSSVIFTADDASLIVNSSISLVISSSITLENQSTSSNSCSLRGEGTINCSSMELGATTNTPSGSNDIYTHIIYSTIANLSISGNLTLNSYYAGFKTAGNAGFYLEDGTLTVSGNISASNQNNKNTSTFSLESGARSGTVYANGAIAFDFHRTRDNLLLNGSSSLVVFGRAGAQDLPEATYMNITLAGSGVKTFINQTSAINGTMSLEGTTTAAGRTPSYGAAATLQYKGDAARTTGIEFPATFSGSGGLIIDNPDGVTIDEDKTVSNSITFINGMITTGANTLTLGSGGSVSGAGSGSYVNGNFEKGIAAATAGILFEIGDATNYTPVNITFSGTTNGTGFISALSSSGDHPQIGTSTFDPAYTVNRYWTLTNNGVTGYTSYDATFNFVSGDLDTGVDTDGLIVGNHNGATWTYPSTGTRTTTSTQAAGLTSFGDFQLGVFVAIFRSAGSGDWNQATTWEVFAGGSWIASPVSPSAGSGTINILSSHTVTITTNLTADELTVDAGGTLALNDTLTLNDGTGTDLSLSGTIICKGSNIITGAGSFVMNPSTAIEIGSPQGIASDGSSGSIQLPSLTFDQASDYIYAGTEAQVTGTGLPATINNLTINNSTGVSLTNSVTINGTLILSDGEFTVNGTLTFQNSDTPVLRTTGSITTSPAANIVFGTAGNTGGAAFTIPAATFTSDPTITNLTLNRANSITLNEQMISVSGIVLCNGPLITNGKLTLLSDISGTALIDGAGTGAITGNVTMQRYLPQSFGYKYVSSPFTSATVSELGDDLDLTFWYPAFFSYDESKTTSGWVAHNDPSDPLTPLSGYAGNFGSVLAADTFDISGTVNNGAISITLYNNNNTYTQGLNLVGNPYPSPIDWDAASGWTKTNIDDAVYFFKSSTSDQYGGTYSSYIAGVSSDGQVSNIIPSMQGFFIHVSDGAYPVSGTFGMNNSVRVTDLSHAFTKSGQRGYSQKGLYPLIRISAEFEDDSASLDPGVIYLHPFASKEFDYDRDALKLLNTDFSVPNIYSTLDDEKILSINALPDNLEFPHRIPLGLKTNRAGNLIIKLQEADPWFDDYSICLYDEATNITTDLSDNNEYILTLEAGKYHNRFFLDIINLSTGLDDIISDRKLFRAYVGNNKLHVDIYNMPGNNSYLSIVDLSGQKSGYYKIKAAGHHEYDIHYPTGIYFVSYRSGNLFETVKIYIGR